MEPTFDFNPKKLPPELLQSIGLAITSFAQTEQFLQEAISACCGVDIEYGKAITTHMQMPLRFSVLRSVAEIRIDDLDTLDELDHHLAQIEECIKKAQLHGSSAMVSSSKNRRALYSQRGRAE